MTVLAVDTTSEHGSLVIRRDGVTKAKLSLHAPQGFSHLVFAAVAELLKAADMRLGEVDVFAAASGPGSFTGVRVGLSLAKGLAEATGRKAAGISNLRVLSVFGTRPLRVPLIDARRGETYAAIYDQNLQLVLGESVGDLPTWLAALPAAEYEFLSHMDLSHLDGTRFGAMPRKTPPQDLAEGVAICTELDDGSDPAALDANYVRKSDAELFWRDR
jgi:tRNA threonylcarbamoyladenosine biosynthesis protein TsaB